VSSVRRHVALIGLRCAGKSCVGRELAQLCGAPFHDLDDELVVAANRTAGRARFDAAGAVLSEWGEPAFRSLETQVLQSLLERRDGVVLATGGGAVLAARNRALLARRARCVWLKVEPVELARRLRADPTPRPPLVGTDAAEELTLLAAQRAPLYAEVADLTLDGASALPAALARTLLARLVEEGGTRPGG
jgi:shikimate kinase